MNASPIVEFLFSPGSRYSYLAASQISALESETGCVVDWIPVSGTDIRRHRGADPFDGKQVSGQYDWGYRERDARDWAEFYRIPFREPPNHKLDFGLLVRAAAAARLLGKSAEYGLRLCTVAYGSEIWPIDHNICVQLAIETGLDPTEFESMMADPKTELSLANAAKNAFEKGAFGVPTFFVGERMFWGNDRIALLKRHLCNQRS